MANQITIEAGSSHTIAIRFDDGINIDILTELTATIAGYIVGSLEAGSIITTDDTHVFLLQLTSDFTHYKTGNHKIQLAYKQTGYGITVLEEIPLTIKAGVNQTHAALKNTEGINTFIDIPLSTTSTATVKELSLVEGKSAYEVAVANGFEGTQDEYAAMQTGKSATVHAGVQLTDNDVWFHNRNSSWMTYTFLDTAKNKVIPQPQVEFLTANSVRVYMDGDDFEGFVISEKFNNNVFAVSDVGDGDDFEHGFATGFLTWTVLDSGFNVDDTVTLRYKDDNTMTVDLSLWDSLLDRDFDGYFLVKPVI